MDFKGLPVKTILVSSLLAVLFIGAAVYKFIPKADSTVDDATGAPVPAEEESSVPALAVKPVIDTDIKEDAAIQEQLDRDRQEERQTKYLKTKLEQTNLELEEQKALVQINKLKMENMDGGMPSVDGQKTLPEVRVEYIGGDNINKEAILSIAGVNYQVKAQSTPTESIQVLSISDSGVTLHFSAPQELTRTIDYKPE